MRVREPLSIGIVGAGGIARFHARGIKDESPSLSLKAVCDTSEEALKRFCETFSDIDVYADYADMFDDPAVDAVLVALPHHLHLDCCLHALRKGKHVLVEKPIARTLDEADAIIKAAQDSDLVLMVGHNQRYMDVYRTIRYIIEEKRLGDLLSISIDHHQNFDPPEGHWWRFREKVGGGCVIGSGIHRLDLLNWYLGEPEEVFAYGVDEARRLEAEAVCSAVIRYASGAVAQFYCNWAVYKPPPSRTNAGEGISVFGRSGTLYLEDKNTLLIALHGNSRSDVVWETVTPDHRGPSMWEHFAECIKEGTTPLTDGTSARKALELVAAVYRSLDSGAPAKLPLS